MLLDEQICIRVCVCVWIYCTRLRLGGVSVAKRLSFAGKVGQTTCRFTFCSVEINSGKK